MELDYDENLEAFNDYILKCRDRIKETLFSDEDIKSHESFKKDFVEKGLLTSDSSVTDAIKLHRNGLIDIKLNHTMRIVQDVNEISKKLGTSIDFDKVLRVSALLHDIARFEQAVYASSFNDRECSIFNGAYHGDYGYKMLYEDNGFSSYKIPKEFQYAIAQVVKHHQDGYLKGDLALKFNNKDELNANALTGNEELNEQEKIIVSALIQMVKDVDMLDILYQHLTGEFPVVRQFVSCKTKGRTLDELAAYYKINPDEIKNYNNITSDDISDKTSINIPVKNIPPEVFEVPKDVQDSFFKNEPLDLSVLNKRDDWSFLVGMWWRLNHFLNSINFVSNLELVSEKELLEQIYNTYPEKYKPFVLPAFEYAKEQILDKTIKENKGLIYTK